MMRTRNTMHPLEVIEEFLSYNYETGVFTRKKVSPRDSFNKVGDACDKTGALGYIMIGVGGGEYSAHLLAHTLKTGTVPTGGLVIDHIDRDKLNNRFNNLRFGTKIENAFNSKIRNDNKTGYRGVRFIATSGRYRATLTKNGVKIMDSTFPTAEEASLAYDKAAQLHQGEFYYKLNGVLI